MKKHKSKEEWAIIEDEIAHNDSMEEIEEVKRKQGIQLKKALKEAKQNEEITRYTLTNQNTH